MPPRGVSTEKAVAVAMVSGIHGMGGVPAVVVKALCKFKSCVSSYISWKAFLCRRRPLRQFEVG